MKGGMNMESVFFFVANNMKHFQATKTKTTNEQRYVRI